MNKFSSGSDRAYKTERYWLKIELSEVILHIWIGEHLLKKTICDIVYNIKK